MLVQGVRPVRSDPRLKAPLRRCRPRSLVHDADNDGHVLPRELPPARQHENFRVLRVPAAVSHVKGQRLLGDNGAVAAWPGLGYVVAGITVLIAAVLAWRHGGELGQSLVDFWVHDAQSAPRRWRWLHGPWADERLDEPAELARIYPWAALPVTVGLSALGLALVVAGVVHLIRG